MSEKNWEEVLGEITGRKLPDCPGNLEANVWRKIRMRQSAEKADFWEVVAGMLVGRLAIPVFALAVALSFTFSALAMSARDNREAVFAKKALGFDALNQPIVTLLD